MTADAPADPVPDPRWLTAEEMRAWLAYRRLRLVLSAAVNRELAQDSGLSEPDYDVLSNLSESGRRRLGELADRMLWSRSRLSHHITRMQDRGLVRREDVDGDARGSDIVLTPAGRLALEEAAPRHVASVRRLFIDRMTPEQIRVLGDIGEAVLGPLGDHTE
ncbi:MarR family winged helix-turn-helix transcriptional regulator [Catenulispora subtropica]|uniref:MarR family transcriptional regulator n=1 Tax=Catenulispora subtropica TaxID=450798 RepID=A0ABN2QY98_9ACTN